jgi:cell division transport system ATP-binding protein
MSMSVSAVTNEYVLRNVAVRFEKIPALHNVSVEIPRGEILVLNGATGAGKTTFLRLLYFDVLPSDGNVLFQGKSVAGLTQEEIAKARLSIGVVFQDAKLLPHISIIENVILPLRIANMPRKQAVLRAVEVMSSLGISYVRDKMSKDLSGGERSLVSFARAIIHEPRVLIADEPTANLDEQTAGTIISAMRGLAEKGTTIILSTHNSATIRELSTAHIIRLHDGTIASGI